MADTAVSDPSRDRLVKAMNRVLDEYARAFYLAFDLKVGSAASEEVDLDQLLATAVSDAARGNEYFDERSQAAVRDRCLDPSSVTQMLLRPVAGFPDLDRNDLFTILDFRNALHHRHRDQEKAEVCADPGLAIVAIDAVLRVLAKLDLSSSILNVTELRNWIQDGLPVVQGTPVEHPSLPQVTGGVHSKDVVLSAEQDRCVRQACDWLRSEDAPRRTFVVSGEAGSGKTTVLAALLQACQINPESIVIATPTTKAREVLRAKLPQRGGWRSRLRTIASVVWKYKYPPSFNGEDIVFEKLGLKDPPTDRRMQGVRVVFVDEASMITDQEHRMLTEHFRVVYFGDPDQLPPVLRDGSADSPADVLDHPDFRLKTIHRQSEESPILQAAAHARAGQQLEFIEFTDDRVQILHETNDCLGRDDFDQLLDQHDVILAGRNITRIRLNRRVRHLRNLLDHPGDVTPKPGEILVATQQMREAFDRVGVQNGQRLVVKDFQGVVSKREEPYSDVLDLRLLVALEDRPNLEDELIISSQMLHGDHVRGSQIVTHDVSGPRSNILRCEWGYALTVHKAQGSEWPRVLVVNDVVGDERVPLARWNYVAYTRAIDQLTVVKLAARTSLIE